MAPPTCQAQPSLHRTEPGPGSIYAPSSYNAFVNVVLQMRTISGLSRNELAACAGVARTTVARIERGEVSPTLDTLNRLAAAAGVVISTDVRSAGDVSAIAAARQALTPEIDIPDPPRSMVWRQRWTAAGLLPAKTPDQIAWLCEVAGRSCRIADRPGVRWFDAITWDEFAARLVENKVTFAISGSAAANRIVFTGTVPWAMTYVASIDAAANALGLVERSLSEPGLKMAVLSLDPLSRVGVTYDKQGFGWVDPWQVVIDCFGGNSRMPDQAEFLCKYLTRGH
jgi:transcriptional regulator with XRE-family HTH domain